VSPDNLSLHEFQALFLNYQEHQNIPIVHNFESFPNKQEISQDINKQFEFISTISNDHWDTYLCTNGTTSKPGSAICYTQHLLFNGNFERIVQRPPTSLRHRLLLFGCIFEDKAMMSQIVDWHLQKLEGLIEPNEPVEASDDTVSGNSTRTKKPRITSNRIAQVTIPRPANIVNVQSVYTSFKESMMLSEGLLMHRAKSYEKGVFIMNSISKQDASFMPLDYEHVSFEKDNNVLILRCSCHMYKHLKKLVGIDDEETILDYTRDTCMHCRLVKDKLLEYCLDTDHSLDKVSGTIREKIEDSLESINNPIVLLRSDRKTRVKMSIMAEDGSCSFVHLSANAEYVTCQSSMCSVKMKNQKKVSKLNRSEGICEHLKTLYANIELLREYLPNEDEHAAPSEAINDEDFNIDTRVCGF
jgi:hypothetical protein